MVDAMKYRGRAEIIDSMLRSIKSGAKKTYIMYEAHMSFGQLKEYLKFLEERELIEYEESSRLYRITQRGVRFMNAYDEITEVLSGASERKFMVERDRMAPLLSS